ncbi:hypothetical protein DFJ73DRAFT_866405 [Zopfochytrium polystomum]|nr:hypothetical protein DFJ73DRAFT_866405 [Zopfochytrium polystomum]
MHVVSRNQVNQARAHSRLHVHLNWQEMMAPLVSTATPQLSKRKIYGWFYWVVSDNLDFGFCSKVTTRKCTNLPPLAHSTFMKYIHLTVAEVQQSIAQTLPTNPVQYTRVYAITEELSQPVLLALDYEISSSSSGAHL